MSQEELDLTDWEGIQRGSENQEIIEAIEGIPQKCENHYKNRIAGTAVHSNVEVSSISIGTLVSLKNFDQKILGEMLEEKEY